MAVVAAVLSLVVLVALLASRPPAVDTGERSPTPQASTTERGDPDLAGRLAEQAALSGGDPQETLRLLLAAHMVAPDRAAHRIALARALLTGADPVTVIQARLDTGSMIKYASLSSDASFLVTGGDNAGHLWQTRSIGDPQRVRLAERFGAAVNGAAGAGMLTRTNLLVAGPDGVSAWRAVTPVHAGPLGRVADKADAVALSPDGGTGVTVAATSATLWDLAGPQPSALATLAYPTPVTTLAFAPGGGLVLAAGHADGRVTVHTINLDQKRTTERTLASPGGPVDAVALSADASRAAAVHQDGTVSVWDLRPGASEPAGTAAGVANARSHRVWLSGTGDYAFVADDVGPPALWSLANPEAPTRLLTLGPGGDPAVPAMISVDGRTVATIDAANVLTIWDIRSLADLLTDPVGRACQVADLTEQRWRQMVPDAALANPCATPGLPSLGVDHD